MEMLLEQISPRSRAKQAPQDLIFEILDGKPLYRKGWQAVLNGKKSLEEIASASTLQGAIVSHLLRKIFTQFDEEKYFVLTNETGIHLDRRNNFAGDILIFDKKTLPPQAIDRHFAKVPSLLHIEVDIKVDTAELGEMQYVSNKTKKMLAFGTRKIIWIFTNGRMILIAEFGKPWQTLDWADDVEIGNGAVFNLENWLRQSGIPGR